MKLSVSVVPVLFFRFSTTFSFSHFFLLEINVFLDSRSLCLGTNIYHVQAEKGKLMNFVFSEKRQRERNIMGIMVSADMSVFGVVYHQERYQRTFKIMRKQTRHMTVKFNWPRYLMLDITKMINVLSRKNGTILIL